MKIICNRSDLAKGVSIVSKAVPTKTTMEILECILIDASFDMIKLTANDMELGIETIVEGDILERGIIAIDAKLLSEIVRKLPDSEVVIETSPALETIITCEKARFVLASKAGDDFSYLPPTEKEDYITISEFSLREVIRQVIFSVADSDTNRIMTGVLFEVQEQMLRVASLDGHRISIRKIELAQSYPSKRVIVPGKALNEISKIINGSSEQDVDISFTENHITFEFENTRVVSRLIEGNYFNIDQMLSSDYETKVTLNKRELLGSIERSILLIRESDKKPIILNIGDEELELNMKAQLGSMKEEIWINKEGKDLRIGFNPRFLIDALRVIDQDEVTLFFMNPKAPCFIRDEEYSYIYLILPVNIPLS